MPDIASYLDKLKSRNASELVLSAERAPLYRSGHTLAPLPGEAPLSDAELRKLLADLLGELQWSLFLAQGSLRFSATHHERTRLCGTLLLGRQGVNSTLRVVPEVAPTCLELGIPDAAVSCMARGPGLLLVAGPSRSGKTSTLAALIAHALARGARHVATVEDPIELLHGSAEVVVSHRQVGAHCGSFAAGIDSACRCDADLIVVSELDAPGALPAALDAIDGGAQVLAAVRTASAATASAQLLTTVPAAQRDRLTARLSRALLCTLGTRQSARATGSPFAAYDLLLPPKH